MLTLKQAINHFDTLPSLIDRGPLIFEERQQVRDWLKQLQYEDIFPEIVQAAREHGYAIGLHGSMKRDCDLIAVPWLDGAHDPEKLIESIASVINGFVPQFTDEGIPYPIKKAYGRFCWVIYLVKGDGKYLDVSVFVREQDK